MGRKPCCEKGGVNRGVWTAVEDKILTGYISLNGEGKWRNLPISAGLKRCGKSCRLRWLNYLKPDIKRGNITREEEDLIIRLHKLLGNRWSLIAGRLPGRTDNEIKNYWNTNIGKKLQGHDQNKPRCLLSPSLRCQKTPTCVVRTRATRCTKVVIPEELQNFQTKDNDEIEKKTSHHITVNNNNNNNVNNNNSMGTVDTLEQGPVRALNESIPSDMKIDKDVDVDMDGHILSKILDAREFLPFSDLQYHHHQYYQQQQQQNEGRMSSPLMNDNLFLGEDVDGELDIDWITRLLETELIEETSH